jgi:serine/threonine protein kinase
MMKLWNFSPEQQAKFVAISLGKQGKLIGEMTSPHSSIYTFDQGASTFPRYVVAKGIQVNDSMPVSEKWKYLRRALYEVNNAHAVCHHPSVQRFFDVEIIHGVPFLLSRKRDATLRDVIAEGALCETETVSIVIQMVHALSYCESKGLLCHQDMKPENIFIDFITDPSVMPPDYPLRCRTFVADFELANAYLILRHPYGSRPYMAPEQYQKLSDGSPLPDFSRVDVFALGVILYEMLTGGVHPIGEHTSLIWPTPAEGQSRKWLREDPWKKWIERGANFNVAGQHNLDREMVKIIQECLKLDAELRISKSELEALLRKRLEALDRHAHEKLQLMLSEFDRLALEGEEDGWPFYTEMVEQLNQEFSDHSEL